MSNVEFKPVQFGLQKELVIYEYERGLLYKDGRFERVLEPGKYRFSRWEDVRVTTVSMRLMSEVISGQEILTSDKIGVRVSLIAVYQVIDPVVAINAVESYTDQLYHDLQLAIRQSVSDRDMEALLQARTELSAELLATITSQASEYGLEVKRVGIRDIVLPGQVRNVFLKEVEADREGRAELVKARHEVAAARARANTAKIMTENPAVLRMQELDALMRLAGKQGNVVMLPNLADLLTRHVSSNGNGKSES